MEETRDLEISDDEVELGELDVNALNNVDENDGSQGPLVENDENLDHTTTGVRRMTLSRKSKITSTIVITVIISMIGFMIYAIMVYKKRTELNQQDSSTTTTSQPIFRMTTEKAYIRSCDVKYNNVTRKEVLVQPAQPDKRKRCEYRSSGSNFMECAGHSEASSIRMKTETLKMIVLPLSKEIYLVNNGARIIFNLRGDVSCVLIRHKVNEVFRRHSREDTCNYSKDIWIGGRKRRELDTPKKTAFHEDGDEIPETRMTGGINVSSIRWSKDYVKPTAPESDEPDEDYDYFDKFIKKVPEYSRFRIDTSLEYFELC